MEDKGFAFLEFYQDSLKRLTAAYRLADSLLNYERYNLSDQLRRAACSIATNITDSAAVASLRALGYGRYHYLGTRGSLSERLSAFLITESVEYCTKQTISWVIQSKEPPEQKFNRYCRFIRYRQQGYSKYGNKSIRD